MKQPTFLNVLKDEIKKYNTHHGADGKFDYCDGSCGSGGGGGSKGGKGSGGSKSSGGSKASGGSGGSSGSSSGGAESRSVNMERRGQLGIQKKPFETVAKECGVGAKEAHEMGKAVNRFTNSDYTDIRRSQNGKMSPDDPKYAKSKRDADLIEEYIKLAPKYDGAVYRGVQSSMDRLKGLKKGAVIDMNGVSSWSSESSVANDFATTYDPNKRSVVFRLPKTNSGTAISHLSSLPHEYEVLMSQQASFKITNVKKDKYVTYVDLTEVSGITKSFNALLHGGNIAKAGAGVKMKLVDRWLSDDDGFRIVSEEADDVEKSNPHRGADGKFTNCDGSCGNGSGAAGTSHGGTGAPDNNAGSGGKKNPGRYFTTPFGIDVVQNPSPGEYRQLYEEVSEKYPFLGPGEPRLRHTYDMDGNEYVWNAYEAIHTSVEPYINEAYGTKTNQNHKWWEKESWREYVLNKSDDGESNDFAIMKSDEDKRLVFGWGSVAINANGEQLVDYQGDMIDPDVMEDAAYEYVLNFRDTGEEHIPSMRKKGKLVESVVFTREKQAAMGIPEGILPVGWWVGFKIHDDRAWEMVKSGKYRMFSIEGRAERIPVEKKRTFFAFIDKGNPHRGADGKFTNCDGSCKGSGSNSMIRQGPPPKNTKIGYKVFCVKNGKLYPPMVANPDAQDTPVGVWLDAQEGVKATNPDGTPVTNTLGRYKVKAGGKGTKGGGGTLAYRPGWHLGELPVADQFYTKNKETGVKEQYPNFVWAECEIAADIDYQKEAMSYGYTKNGKFQHSLAGLPRLPVDGYYKYRTNPNPDTKPWYITGSMKVNRILTDAETNKILRENGIEPMPRKGGELDLEALGITERDFTVNKSKKKRSFLDIIRKANPHRGADGKFTYCDGSCGNGAGAAGSKRNYGKTDVGDAVPGDCLSSHIGSDGKLTPEREELHKQIIDKFLEGKTPAAGTPQLTMMGGGPASGKSTMIKEGFVKDPDTSSDIIKIDPDAIKAELPEYKSMVEAGDKNASAYVHEESSALAKRLYGVALSEGINVTYDGTGDGSVKSVMKKVNAAKSQGYEIVGEYASCDIDEAIRRADARGDKTGRYVNHDYLKACHAKVTDIAYECSPKFDKINVYDTTGEIKLIATGGNGKNLSAVDAAGFNAFMSKGQKFITLPNGQVVPIEE